MRVWGINGSSLCVYVLERGKFEVGGGFYVGIVRAVEHHCWVRNGGG